MKKKLNYLETVNEADKFLDKIGAELIMLKVEGGLTYNTFKIQFQVKKKAKK